MVLARDGAVGGVDVRGAAPGTRETDLLRVENAVDGVHGLVFSGGSAYGLATGSGVMRYLEEQGVGHRVREFIVPIVPGAIIFDLGIGTSARPTDADGYAAAAAANDGPVVQGSVGAGTGATVGKALGRGSSMKGGVGSASMDVGDGVVLAALAVVNAIGGVHEPDTGELLAGARDDDGKPRGSIGIYADPAYGARTRPSSTESLANTTLGIIATSVSLTKSQTNRLATVAHDGLALAIRPVHTIHDGDTVFALATGIVDAADEFPRLCVLAPTVMARAIVNAVRNAESLHGVPAMSDVNLNG